MKYKKIIDMHTHTDNSPDGMHSPVYMCERAEQAGLRGIAFTDHCEVDSFYEESYDRATVQAYFEVAKARSVFSGKLIVLEGIELGQPAYNPALAEKLLSSYNYDVVLGSVHNLRDEQDFYYMEHNREKSPVYFERYLDALLEMIEWGGMDVLSHLTYPLRYMMDEKGVMVDIKKYGDKIEQILKKLVEAGIALEINTSGLRQNIGETLPPLEIVKRYKELGGEYITIGSDSHKADDLGTDIHGGMEIAEQAGFKYVTLFQDRMPIPIPIE